MGCCVTLYYREVGRKIDWNDRRSGEASLSPLHCSRRLGLCLAVVGCRTVISCHALPCPVSLPRTVPTTRHRGSVAPRIPILILRQEAQQSGVLSLFLWCCRISTTRTSPVATLGIGAIHQASRPASHSASHSATLRVARKR
jgi:hypothetical protein